MPLRLVTLLLPLLLAGCSWLPGFQRPEVLGVRPEIDNIDFRGIDLAFDVRVRNPYPVALRDPQLDYALDILEAPLVSGSTQAGSAIPAGGIGSTRLPLRLEYSEVFHALDRFAQSRELDEIPYRLEGAFRMGKAGAGRSLRLPFNHTGKVPVLRVPRVEATRFEPGEVGLGGASFALDANIFNPNVFPIGIEDLGYRLRIGDIEIGRLEVQSTRRLEAKGSGSLRLSGRLSGFGALGALTSARPGAMRLEPRGRIDTPYGKIRLPQWQPED